MYEHVRSLWGRVAYHPRFKRGVYCKIKRFSNLPSPFLKVTKFEVKSMTFNDSTEVCIPSESPM